jgi:ATP-dependent RNA helicase CshB
LEHPQNVNVESDEVFKPRVNHVLVPAKHLDYSQMLLKILPHFQPYICLIFANTRVEAAQMAQLLRDEGISIIELHGDLTPRQRRQAMTQLENKEHSYIVATDIASRGLDISEVTHVVSLGFPKELEFFIHRSGRTGRAGKEGTCFTIYKESDDAAIRHFQKMGISFKHMTISASKWRELKPYGYKHAFKRSETEIAIAKIVKRKDIKVKPGYKKKMNAEIEMIKRKKKREFIQGEIKKQKKERAKAKSLAEKETS